MNIPTFILFLLIQFFQHHNLITIKAFSCMCVLWLTVWSYTVPCQTLIQRKCHWFLRGEKVIHLDSGLCTAAERVCYFVIRSYRLRAIRSRWTHDGEQLICSCKNNKDNFFFFEQKNNTKILLFVTIRCEARF